MSTNNQGDVLSGYTSIATRAFGYSTMVVTDTAARTYIYAPNAVLTQGSLQISSLTSLCILLLYQKCSNSLFDSMGAVCL